MFDLSAEEDISVWGELMAFAGFVVESEKQGEVAHGIVGNRDGYSFFFRTTNEVAGRCAHGFEDILCSFLVGGVCVTLSGVEGSICTLTMTRRFPRIRFHEWQIPQVFCKEVEGR